MKRVRADADKLSRTDTVESLQAFNDDTCRDSGATMMSLSLHSIMSFNNLRIGICSESLRACWGRDRRLPSALDFARAHGMGTYEPRQGRNAATVVCSSSAVVTLASFLFSIFDCRFRILDRQS